MRFQNPKGTRDFYPEEMVRLNRVLDVWRRVSRRHGFVEYDGPTFESFELLAAKSGANLMPPILQAVRAMATLGEICDTLRGVFGEYEAAPFV